MWSSTLLTRSTTLNGVCRARRVRPTRSCNARYDQGDGGSGLKMNACNWGGISLATRASRDEWRWDQRKDSAWAETYRSVGETRQTCLAAWGILCNQSESPRFSWIAASACTGSKFNKNKILEFIWKVSMPKIKSYMTIIAVKFIANPSIFLHRYDGTKKALRR